MPPATPTTPTQNLGGRDHQHSPGFTPIYRPTPGHRSSIFWNISCWYYI